MKRMIAALCAALSLSLVFCFLLFIWIVTTSSGLKAFVLSLGGLTPHTSCRVEHVAGNLLHGASLHGVEVLSNTAVVSCARLDLGINWHELLEKKIYISRFVLQDVAITLENKEIKTISANRAGFPQGLDTFFSSLPQIHFPFAMDVVHGRIDGLSIRRGTDTIFVLDGLQSTVTCSSSSLLIKDLSFKAANYTLTLHGHLETRDSWPVTLEGEYSGSPPQIWKMKQNFRGSFTITDSLKKGHVRVAVQAPLNFLMEGDFSLSKNPSWSLPFSLNIADTRLIAPTVPGSVAVQGLFTGDLQRQNPQLRLELPHIVATAFSQKIEGNVKLDYDGVVHLQRMELALQKMESRVVSADDDVGAVHTDAGKNGKQKGTEPGTQQRMPKGTEKDASADSVVSAVFSGDIGETVSLHGNFSATGARPVFTWLQGAYSGSVDITGPRNEPSLALQLQGHDITAAGFSAKQIHIVGKGQLAPQGKMHLQCDVVHLADSLRNLGNLAVTLEGTLLDHTLALSLQGENPAMTVHCAGGMTASGWQGKIEDAVFTIPGQGNLALTAPVSLDISSQDWRVGNFCLQHDTASLCGQAYMKNGKWQGVLDLISFNPAYFFPEFPGSITAKLTTEGNLSKKTGSFELMQLAGSLLGQRLSGGGGVVFTGDMLRFKTLQIRLGNAEIAAAGNLGKSSSLSLDLRIPDLSTFIPSAKGKLTAHGTVSRDNMAPRIDARLQGTGMVMAGLALKSMQAKARLDLQPGGVVDLQVTGKGADIQGHHIESFVVNSQGLSSQHQFSLALQSDAGTIDFAGNGRYVKGIWQGQISQGNLDVFDLGNVRLQTVPRLSWQNGSGTMDNICFSGEAFSGCANLGYTEGMVSFSGKIDSLDLARMKLYESITSYGLVHGTVSGSLSARTGLLLDASLDSPKIEVADNMDDQRIGYSFDNCKANLHLQGDDGKFTFQTESAGKGSISGTIFSSGLEKGLEESSLSGQLHLAWNDLSLLTLLSDATVVSDGTIAGDLQFSGSLMYPQVTGQLDLEQGGLSFPALGSHLSAVTAQLQTNNNGLIFTAQGTSGAGSLLTSGQLVFQPAGKWLLTLKGSGHDLNVVKRKDYDLTVDGTYSFSCDGDGGFLKTDLLVPHGRIAMKQEQSLVTASSDVVFADAEKGGREQNWQFQTRMNLIFGKDVSFQGYGLTGFLTGKLRYEDLAGKNPMATGEIALQDGQYKLYTTELDIKRGLIQFTGGAVDNPGVDFQAIRKVGEYTVGVNVGGTLDDMRYELFSDPVMDETDILAYMVVGKSLSSSGQDEQGVVASTVSAMGLKGVGNVANELDKYLLDDIQLSGTRASQDMSLLVGKNLTQKLFIGYNHNFYEDTGGFKVIYKLGHGFSVETESSIDATGGDILYTIEK